MLSIISVNVVLIFKISYCFLAELCEYATGEEKEYQFREIKGKSIRFLVKAAHDAHLAFTSAAEETEPMVEVFIGGWEGAASAIRYNKGKNSCFFRL